MGGGAFAFREEGVGVQPVGDCRLGFEAPCCVAFERLLDDGCHDRIGFEHLTTSAHQLVAVANGGLERPVAVLRAGAHPVLGLLGILLALVLRDACEDILVKL
jgi:hypothetical protein